MTADELREKTAIAICRSRQFETGQGTCAVICMDQLGDPRARGCCHAKNVHKSLANAVNKAALKEVIGELKTFAGISGAEEEALQVSKYFISRIEALLPEEQQ